MSTTDHDEKTVRHWKSLEEWRQDPEVQKLAENEFMTSPFAQEGDLSPRARRDFLKLMGASLALSSAGCLRRPVQKIIPYVNRPKEIIPGVANYYTSTLKDQGEGFGIIVKTREGRPIKIEGNPQHPLNQGGLSARAHAHVLSLYDPDRLREPKSKGGKAISWEDVDAQVKERLGQGSVVVLTPTLSSPSTEKVVGDFSKAFKGRHVTWDAIGADATLEAAQRSYGVSSLPHYHFDKASLVVSIDGDFLGTLISPSAFTRQFGAKRNPDGKMNRLVVFESMMTLTGQNSDQRFPIRASEQLDVVMLLVSHILEKSPANKTLSSTVASYVSGIDKLSVDKKAISDLADELWAQRGQSLVISGGLAAQTSAAVELQLAVNLLNWLLKNEGETIDRKASLNTLQGSYSELQKLIAEMELGQVGTLVMYKTNPAYTLPTNSGFVEALKKVPTVIYAGDANESGALADFNLPVHHDLENWGDSEFIRGVRTIQQPTIRPLYKTRAFEELLLGWLTAAGKATDANWYNYLREEWKAHLGYSNFESKWDEALQTGVSGRIKHSSSRSFNTSSVSGIKRDTNRSEYELVLYEKIGLGDGALANMSWMQELPDPVTKIVWDNYVNVAPSTAKKLKLEEGDVVQLKAGQVTVEVPVHIQPGVHPGVFAVAVGYGRTAAGQVGNGVGVNAFALASVQGGKSVFSGTAATLTKTAKKIKIANVQGHHTMFGRNLAFETTHKEYEGNKKAGHVKPHFTGEIWPAHQYKGHKWGMSIDVNSCTGCSACVVACQAENNIPVVGKKYILQGREMHWLRIDRYYSEEPDNPETLHQLMLCQHCDNAPCETVCPVVATSHSDEGLNEMTYNRCVGTRYCANNCPYKVRRFNWFAYDKYREPQEMVLNPEVGVRSRGVMEKCSFCVQRIKEKKNVAKDEGRALKDGEIQTACQQSCPGDAIVFGDTNDPESQVSKRIADKRSYVVLADLNVKPAIHYMTKIRNRPPRKTTKGGHH